MNSQSRETATSFRYAQAVKIRPDALGRPNAGPGTCAGPRRRKGGVQTRDISYRNAASRALRWLEALQQLAAPVSAKAFVALDMHIGRKSRSGRERRRCVAEARTMHGSSREGVQLFTPRRCAGVGGRPSVLLLRGAFRAWATQSRKCSSRRFQSDGRSHRVQTNPSGPGHRSVARTVAAARDVHIGRASRSPGQKCTLEKGGGLLRQWRAGRPL